MKKLNEARFFRANYELVNFWQRILYAKFSWPYSKTLPLPYCSLPPSKDNLPFHQTTPFIMTPSLL